MLLHAYQRQHLRDLSLSAHHGLACTLTNCNPRPIGELRHYPLRIAHRRGHQTQPPMDCLEAFYSN